MSFGERSQYQHLELLHRDVRAGRPRREEVGESNQAGDGEGDGSEKAEDGLRADEGGVHCCSCLGIGSGVSGYYEVLCTQAVISLDQTSHASSFAEADAAQRIICCRHVVRDDLALGAYLLTEARALLRYAKPPHAGASATSARSRCVGKIDTHR